MQATIDFILELDKLKGITRKVKPIGLDRYENSAEHSWHLCVAATSLAHYAETPVNLDRVIRMLLVHDIGEIDAGDTLVYVEGGWEERKAKELAGVKRVCGMLSAELATELTALWEEFEDVATPEARFAHAVDRSMPILLNLSNDGQSWRENNIRLEQVIQRNGPPIQAGCPKLWAYLEPRLQDAQQQGFFRA